MSSYDAWKLASPPVYDELGEEHERLCCDEHFLHHTHGDYDQEWPIGGCWTCESVVLETVKRLASNLAIGAALCEAFRLGFDEGWDCSGEGFNAEYTSRSFTPDKYELMATVSSCASHDGAWRPGCGRDATP